MKQRRRRLSQRYAGMSKSYMLKMAKDLEAIKRSRVTIRTGSRLEEFQRRIP